MLLLMTQTQTGRLDKREKSYCKQDLAPLWIVTLKDSQLYLQIRWLSWTNGSVSTIDYLKKTGNFWMLSLRANILLPQLRMRPILALLSSYFVMRKSTCTVGLSTTFRATLQILEVLASYVSWFCRRLFPFLCLLTWPSLSWTTISDMNKESKKILRKPGATPLKRSIP